MSSPVHHSNIIYGRNPVLEAIEGSKRLERIFLRDNLTGEFEKLIRNHCKDHGIPLKKVPPIKLDKLCRNRAHQGVVAIGSIIDYVSIDMVVPHIFEAGEIPLLVLLDNVTDVRNIGAVARSTEALGGHALILSGKNSGMVNEDTLKASAGAITKLIVCREKNTVDTILLLQSFGVKVIGTSLSATTYLAKLTLTEPLCIVLGSEGDGLHRSVSDSCDELALIPQSGSTDSLNVSVASGIALYEAIRQRS
ncbi:MAG: 23S rRNA (guanosine(2251)-2'-O)-methyltransferase RlmB [Bacteroidota bacterium]